MNSNTFKYNKTYIAILAIVGSYCLFFNNSKKTIVYFEKMLQLYSKVMKNSEGYWKFHCS